MSNLEAGEAVRWSASLQICNNSRQPQSKLSTWKKGPFINNVISRPSTSCDKQLYVAICVCGTHLGSNLQCVCVWWIFWLGKCDRNIARFFVIMREMTMEICKFQPSKKQNAHGCDCIELLSCRVASAANQNRSQVMLFGQLIGEDRRVGYFWTKILRASCMFRKICQNLKSWFSEN